MLKVLLASLFATLTTTVQAQTPFETNTGRLCLEAWITEATGTLNSYDGSDGFDARKPWRVNRFGLFMGEGMASNFEPDNWVANGANRDTYMWNIYDNEAQYPSWSLDILRNAFVPGLRYYVEACLENPPMDTTQTPATTTGAIVPPGAMCPPSLSLLNAYPGVILGCQCNANPDPSGIWGSNTYTSDSDLCAAAQHAGVIPASGGTVWATISDGLAAYTGSTRFGISSSNYGAYDTSTTFLNAPAEIISAPVLPRCPGSMQSVDGSISCTCEAGSMDTGTVWGTGTYTDDSNLCRAALHAGVISTEGGAITAVTTKNSGTYSGSLMNGVESTDYGTWDNAFYFPE